MGVLLITKAERTEGYPPPSFHILLLLFLSSSTPLSRHWLETEREHKVLVPTQAPDHKVSIIQSKQYVQSDNLCVFLILTQQAFLDNLKCACAHARARTHTPQNPKVKNKAIPVPLVGLAAQGLASSNRCEVLQVSSHSQHQRYPTGNNLLVLG